MKTEFQLPEFLPFRRGEQLEAGPGRGDLAGDGLAPVVAGAAEALLVFLVEFQLAVTAGEALFPGRQQGVQAGCARLEGFPQLPVHQLVDDARHQKPIGAGTAAGQLGIGAGGGHHLGHLGGQLLQPAAVVFPVEQRAPAGFAVRALRQPAAPGDQAEAPALDVAPPEQVIPQARLIGA